MENTPSEKPHVVIVGAGFGGLEAAKKLACENVRVTVIDRTALIRFKVPKPVCLPGWRAHADSVVRGRPSLVRLF